MNAVDTNVLIYACDTRDAARQETALRLLTELADGVLLWQVTCEFIAASRKLSEQGFTPAAAWERLAEFMRLMPLVTPSPAVLDKARPLHTAAGVSFWDAMILAACIEAGVTRLYSEDLPGNVHLAVEVVNPFARG